MTEVSCSLRSSSDILQQHVFLLLRPLSEVCVPIAAHTQPPSEDALGMQVPQKQVPQTSSWLSPKDALGMQVSQKQVPQVSSFKHVTSRTPWPRPSEVTKMCAVRATKRTLARRQEILAQGAEPVPWGRGEG